MDRLFTVVMSMALWGTCSAMAVAQGVPVNPGAPFNSGVQGVPPAQEIAASHEFFPTAIGTQWVYRAGVVEVIERITAHERMGTDVCARVESILNGKVISHEHITVRPDGVYRVAVADQPVNPPFRFMKLPLQLDDTWEVKSTVLGQSISGKFQTSQATVTVPAGKYQTLTTNGTGFLLQDQQLAFTYYFAKGIGKVKQTTRIGSELEGKDIVLELKEFKPGQTVANGPTTIP